MLPKSISASDVGQTFLSAGSGDFPVPGFRVKLSALVREVGKLRNRQARKPALPFGQHAPWRRWKSPCRRWMIGKRIGRKIRNAVCNQNCCRWISVRRWLLSHNRINASGLRLTLRSSYNYDCSRHFARFSRTTPTFGSSMASKISNDFLVAASACVRSPMHLMRPHRNTT